jgi:hypothetical protein
VDDPAVRRTHRHVSPDCADKSGVYTCGAKKGGSGHSVVIIGWGVENNTIPYWLVKNRCGAF